MHRSSSSARVSGDLSDQPPPQSHRPISDDTSDDVLLLPTYNPNSYIAIKEQNQIRSAEAAIHLIPFLLALCAIILWFFSDPVPVSYENTNSNTTTSIRKVQIESIQTVPPSRPSERKCQRVWVAKDVLGAVFSRRFHVILYYNKASEDDSGWVTAGWMKETLGQALVDHPMLSGRLLHATDHIGDDDDHHECMEIVSNDSGVRFYEARVCSKSLKEVLLEGVNNELEAELVVWEDIDQQNPQFSPLSYVQVTNFKCGGYSIGCSCSLLVMDPITFTTFLKKWANIHQSILSKPQIPKLPLFYLPNLQKTTNPMLTTTSLHGQDKGTSIIFKAKSLSLSRNLHCDAALCIEEVESKRGIIFDKGSNFSLIVKREFGETKAETLSRQEHEYEHEHVLVCEKWDGLIRDDEMVLKKGKRPASVSYWISSVLDQGLVIVIDGCKSGMLTTFIVTLPQ